GGGDVGGEKGGGAIWEGGKGGREGGQSPPPIGGDTLRRTLRSVGRSVVRSLEALRVLFACARGGNCDESTGISPARALRYVSPAARPFSTRGRLITRHRLSRSGAPSPLGP